jgi:hypothetical protein
MFVGSPPAPIVWGGLRNIALASHVAASIADFPGAPAYMRIRYSCLAVSQLNYILGDTGRSFVVGQGDNWPLQPHSREAFCRMDALPLTCSAGRFEMAPPNQNVCTIPRS